VRQAAVAAVAVATASLRLLAQPAGAAKPPKWTPQQEQQATEYYAAVGRDPACGIKLAKKAYPKFKEWSRGGTRKFDRLRAQVKKKCAAVEPTPIPTVTAATSIPATTTSPAPDRGQWNAGSEELLLGLIKEQPALAPYDPQCVLHRIEAHYATPQAYIDATQRRDPEITSVLLVDIVTQCS
jgi:hypothetical protein